MIDAALFEVLANEAFMGLCVFERTTGKCLYLNQMAKETLGISQNLVDLDLNLGGLFPKEPANFLRPLSKFIVDNEGYFQDIIVSRRQEGDFIADIGVKHFSRSGSEYLMLMIRDVTIQKKLQREVDLKQKEIQNAFEEILAQNKALLELDKAKDRFVALTTHELRTPLSAILAMADVLVNKLYDTPEQMDEFTKMIQSEGRHLMEIVNDILDIAKIKAGKMDFFVEQLDLAKVIKSHMLGFNAMAAEKQVRLEFENHADSALAYIDPLRFSQAFNNVLNNAIKFTRPSTQVKVLLERVASGLQVSIMDQGPGIPKDKETAVFDEFETIGNVNTHHKGTGLGMPITKRIIEALGGSIRFESVWQTGTTFYLCVPSEKILDESFYQSRPNWDGEEAA